MNIEGVEVEKEMIQSFQEFVPKSQGAILLERLVSLIAIQAKSVLTHPGATLEELKIAQGKVIALMELEELANRFASMDLEKWGKPVEAEIEDGDSLMEAADVRY